MYFPPPHLLNLHLMPNAHRWNPINHISSALSEHMFGLQDNCTHPPLHRAELQGSPPLQLTLHLHPSSADKQRYNESCWVLLGFGPSFSWSCSAKATTHSFLGSQGASSACLWLSFVLGCRQQARGIPGAPRRQICCLEGDLVHPWMLVCSKRGRNSQKTAAT